MKPPGHSRRLLVFARNPIPGQVKTRLIPALGVDSATAVYRRMLQDTLATGSRVKTNRCQLWIDHPDPHPPLTQLADRWHMSVHLQSGPDLGARMHYAFAENLQAEASAVLIGSDCPEYDVPYLDAAFVALEQHDAVLGPAADGGYVLIGLKSAEPSLFHDMPWGTDRVLAATRRRLLRLQWSWLELPTRHDVDNPEDLLRFPHLTQLAHPGPLDGPGK